MILRRNKNDIQVSLWVETDTTESMAAITRLNNVGTNYIRHNVNSGTSARNNKSYFKKKETQKNIFILLFLLFLLFLFCFCILVLVVRFCAFCGMNCVITCVSVCVYREIQFKIKRTPTHINRKI